MFNPDEWMSVQEVAQALGVNNATVRGWRHRGTEPVRSVKIGSAVLYRRSQIEDYAAGTRN